MPATTIGVLSVGPSVLAANRAATPAAVPASDRPSAMSARFGAGGSSSCARAGRASRRSTPARRAEWVRVMRNQYGRKAVFVPDSSGKVRTSQPEQGGRGGGDPGVEIAGDLDDGGAGAPQVEIGRAHV